MHIHITLLSKKNIHICFDTAGAMQELIPAKGKRKLKAKSWKPSTWLFLYHICESWSVRVIVWNESDQRHKETVAIATPLAALIPLGIKMISNKFGSRGNTANSVGARLKMSCSMWASSGPESRASFLSSSTAKAVRRQTSKDSDG